MRNTDFADKSNKEHAKPKYHINGWKSWSEMTAYEKESYKKKASELGKSYKKDIPTE